jgi:phosphate starvation-inducible PhoH-like protein
LNVHQSFFEQEQLPAQASELDRYLTRRERKQLKKRGSSSQPMDIKQGYKPLTAKTETQDDYIDSLNTASQVFAIGPAGTGKTYIPSRMAARKLKAREIEKIYIARPTVSHKRHQQGFLPGKLEQKLAPWLVPLLEAIKDEVNPKTLDDWMNTKQVEFLSFEHLRGRTLRDCWVILDEAQNCTLGDLKLFLTRKGENSVYVVTGDIDQVDIEDSGLGPIVQMIDQYDLTPDIIEFDETEVVRSEDAKEWVQAFKRASQ